MRAAGIDVVETAGRGPVRARGDAGAASSRWAASSPATSILLDHATTGDGLLTALQLLAGHGRARGQPLRELAAVMTRLPQVLINVPGVDKALVAASPASWLPPSLAAEAELGGVRPGAAAARAGPSRWSASWSRRRTPEQARAVAERLADAVRADLPEGCRRRSRAGYSADERVQGLGTSLAAMCGIVGYVGDQQALGRRRSRALRRLEYRGYDSAGVAVRRRRRSSPAAKRAGKLGQPRDGAGRAPDAAGRHGRHRPHPLGHPRRAHRPQRAPAPGLRRPARRDPQRDHRELRRPARRARGRTATSCARRPTPRSSRTCSSRRRTTPGPARDLGRGDAPGLPRLRRRVHAGRRARATTRTSVVGARRNSPLVVGRGRRRELPRPATSPRSSRTPARRSSSARTRSSRCAPDAVTVTDFDGAAGRGARRTTSTGTPSAAEKGGFDYFMLKEIAEQPRAVADTLLGRVDADGRLTLDEMRLSDDELRDVDKIVIVACGTAYHAGLIAKYAIEHWTRIPCEVELASEFRYRDPILTRSHPGHRDLPVRRDDGHADGGPARPRAARPGPGDLQRQRLDDPARVRRGALHPRRPGDRGRVDEGVPDPAGRLLPGRRCTSPRCAAPSTATRSAPCLRRARSRCRPQVEQVLDTRWSRSARLARDARPTRARVLFLGRHVGLPGRARGCAEAQGAGLHARRGLRGRRAQARADRADRGGPAGRRASCRRRAAARSCTTRSCRNIQEIRARGARTIVIAEEGDDVGRARTPTR